VRARAGLLLLCQGPFLDQRLGRLERASSVQLGLRRRPPRLRRIRLSLRTPRRPLRLSTRRRLLLDPLLNLALAPARIGRCRRRRRRRRRLPPRPLGRAPPHRLILRVPLGLQCARPRRPLLLELCAPRLVRRSPFLKPSLLFSPRLLLLSHAGGGALGPFPLVTRHLHASSLRKLPCLLRVAFSLKLEPSLTHQKVLFGSRRRGPAAIWSRPACRGGSLAGCTEPGRARLADPDEGAAVQR
jgi:hypothetical protein